MAIADTITSMYENVGEVYDTITNVEMPTNKNIENIPSTIRKSYLNIMNNGYQDIWNNWNKVTGSGTTLSINGTVQAPMSLVYKGQTSQTGTPTPDSPQQVHTVSGDNSIGVCGKNLVKDKRVDSSTAIYGVTLFADIDFQPSTMYTISFNGTNGNQIYANERLFTTGPYINITNERTIVTLTTKDTLSKSDARQYNSTYQKWVIFKNGKTEDNANVYDNLQIEKNNQATSYEPYQSNSYDIDLGNTELCSISTYKDRIFKSNGKNLLGINSVSSTTVGGITYSVSNGVISLSGTANVQSGASIIDIPLLETIQSSLGTLTKSLNRVGTYTGVQTSLRGQVADTSVGLLSNDGTNNTGTISGDAYWFRIQINNGVSVNCTITPQIELGTSSSAYEPYGTGWYVKKEIGKVVFNGTETWWTATQILSSNFYRYENRDFRDTTKYMSRTKYVSNYFKFSNNTNTTENIIVNTNSEGLNRLWIIIDTTYMNGTTENDFKNWLSNHNTTVYYVLATPTYETITDTTLLGQLEAIKKSYKDQTNISQENNDMPFELDITALSK